MRLALLVALLAACTKPNAANCLDNHCNDPELPFCDVDGAIGGEPNTCIAVTCTAGEFAACRDDRALVCAASGDNYDLVDCEFGCGATGCNPNPCTTPECEKRIVPRYIPDECTSLGATDLTISSGATIDSSNPLNCTRVVAQVSGPEICVAHYKSITIAPNQTLTITGTRVVALVADRDVTVQGIIDASASLDMNGPGGGTRTSGTGADRAGGGAGNKTRGGHGATDAGDGAAANGGAPQPNPSTLAELFGGTRAVRAATDNVPGGGGGGLAVISCRGKVAVSGTIDAGGGGGRGDANFNLNYFYAAGGGSGGTIVLQGLTIDVTGQLFANGGGGGSGGNPGFSGSDGTRSTTGAAGGLPPTTFGGPGGVGGATTPAQDGRKGTTGTPGAGGGSAGFILTYTPAGVMPSLNPLVISPAFETNGTIATN